MSATLTVTLSCPEHDALIAAIKADSDLYLFLRQVERGTRSDDDCRMTLRLNASVAWAIVTGLPNRSHLRAARAVLEAAYWEAGGPKAGERLIVEAQRARAA